MTTPWLAPASPSSQVVLPFSAVSPINTLYFVHCVGPGGISGCRCLFTTAATGLTAGASGKGREGKVLRAEWITCELYLPHTSSGTLLVPHTGGSSEDCSLTPRFNFFFIIIGFLYYWCMTPQPCEVKQNWKFMHIRSGIIVFKKSYCVGIIPVHTNTILPTPSITREAQVVNFFLMSVCWTRTS